MAQIYVDQMFNLGGAAVTALTNMNSRATSDGSGAYSPLVDGHLLDLTVMLTPQAASSLAQSGYMTLSATSWAPVNLLTIPFAGFGLATAPQVYGGSIAITVWRNLNLPVKSAVKILGQVQYSFSPVTPFIAVTGTFTTA